MNGNAIITFCADVDKSALLNNVEKRGWQMVGPEDEWNFYWSGTQTCRNLFGVESNYRLGAKQIINHFPNHYELSRKDALIKNIKRYRKEMEKEYTTLTMDGSQFAKNLDFMPTTFILPSDYNMFVEEFRKNSNTDNNKGIWIVKPRAKSQGIGIFLINKLSSLKKHSRELNLNTSCAVAKQSYIISRYIDNPLLIGGKKFDLRLYVLVTSFNPLKAYLYNEGFCRFCTAKYENSSDNLDNIYAHLTNVSVQKKGSGYNNIHGGKWSLSNLRVFLESTRGKRDCDKLFQDIRSLVLHSLKSVCNVISNDRHCFECYGYDVIIDDQLKPWLIEINSSPSLTATTVADRILKYKLIDNIINIVLPPSGVPDINWDKNPSERVINNFEFLFDAENNLATSKNAKR